MQIRILRPLTQLSGASGLWALDVEPGGNIIAVATEGHLGFWDAADRSVLRTISTPAGVRSLRFGPGSRLALLDDVETLHIWGIIPGAEQ